MHPGDVSGGFSFGQGFKLHLYLSQIIMPTDSTNLNIKATPQNTYDAIVVGSGISGGWAAKELCEKGLKVLLLERGRPMEHPNYPTATMNPWDFQHRLELSREDIESHPIQSRHYSFKEDNKHFYIN